MLRTAAMFTLSLSLTITTSALAGEPEIVAITFDEIPAGTEFVGSSTIKLEGDTAVTGDVSATGEVTSDTGYRFPDGTVQTSAAETTGASANLGLYNNRIADISPPLAYTEICIKDGQVMSDIHGTGEPTAGGSCLPGDLGWIIERFERDGGTPTNWTTARMECLKNGMRLPEPFEWQFACDNSGEFAISDMTDNFELASNTTRAGFTSVNFLYAPLLGNGTCSHVSVAPVGNSNGLRGDGSYRCVR